MTNQIRPTDWGNYLEGFHARRPGITDDILRSTTRRGISPHRWMVEPVSEVTRLLDLACGNAPLHGLVSEPAWTGVDRSAAELARALQRGARRLIRSDASALPFPAGSFDGFVCSMALMLLQPLDPSLAELRRVLRPGATGVISIPGTWPLTAADLWRYGRIMASLRITHLRYPNDHALLHLRRVMVSHGFGILSDQRRRFAFPVDDDSSGRRFVRSLYLPGVAAARVRSAETAAAHWAGHRIGIPLRRIVVRAR